MSEDDFGAEDRMSEELSDNEDSQNISGDYDDQDSKEN